MVEESLTGMLENSYIVQGRLNGSLPREGELNPQLVKLALQIPLNHSVEIPSIVRNRPPALCKGCGHIDMYN